LPSFLWVLRDFSLVLQDSFGSKISPRQYLENALKLQKGGSEISENKNKIRHQIQAFFKERDCMPLVRPTESESKLHELNEAPGSVLRPEFLEQIGQLRAKVCNRIKPKYFGGKAVTPCMFIEMMQTYVAAINRGDVPTIENNWDMICQSECRRLVLESSAQFRLRIEEFLAEVLREQDQHSETLILQLAKRKKQVRNSFRALESAKRANTC